MVSPSWKGDHRSFQAHAYPALNNERAWRDRLVKADGSSPNRLLRIARIAMLVQAAALVVLIGLSFPKYLDYLVHPITCTPGGWCIDLRGLDFEISATFLGPPALLLAVTSWLWRRPGRWPAVLPIVLDVVFIALVIYDATSVALTRHDQNPPVFVQVVLVLAPAVVSLTLLLLLLHRQARSPGK